MRSAIILAGGRSSRFSTDKSLFPLGGKTMIEHVLDKVSGIVDETLVVVGDPRQGKKISTVICETRITYDSIIGYGPVAGILAGLLCAKGEYTLVIACDMPFVNASVVDFLFSLAGGYDAVVPRWSDGNIEPLHAVYKRNSMIKACEKAIEKDERTISSSLHALPKVRYVSTEEIKEIDPELRTFINVNTPSEFENLLQKSI
ncbi:MAG: molybdenum cofactor guanylyltransferase [Methanocellales archaeon]|nr:molybdenum cofactor guanylyltransferase [Methanocellales archaeon]